MAILLQEQVGRVGCGGYNARGSNARRVISGLVMTSFVTGVDCLIVIPRRYCGYCCLHTQDFVVVEDLGDVHSHFLNRQPQRHRVYVGVIFAGLFLVLDLALDHRRHTVCNLSEKACECVFPGVGLSFFL